MSKKMMVTRRCYNVVKLDADIWHEIGRYIESKYDDISISIEREDGTDIADSMGFAYGIVCEHTEEIKYISIKANSEDEEMELDFKARGEGARYSMNFEEACRDKESYRAAQIFSDKLLSLAQASTNMVRLSSIMFYYTFVYIAMVVLRTTEINRWLVYLLLLILAVAALLLDFYVYNPVLERWIYKGQRVQLWVDDEAIARYRRMNTISKVAGWSIFFTACLVMLLVTFNI